MKTYYASLVGPLLGYYLPLPDELKTHAQRCDAMRTSRLAKLYCSIYDHNEVQELIDDHGGAILEKFPGAMLDYDHHAVLEGKIA